MLLRGRVFLTLAVVGVGWFAVSLGSAGGSARRTVPARPAAAPAARAMHYPQSVSFVSTSTGWVWGPISWSSGQSRGMLLRTDDGGGSWHVVNSPAVRWFAPSGGATQVHFTDLRHGYIYGPELWYTADGGQHWRKLATRGPVVDVEGRGGAVFALVVPSHDGRAMGSVYVDRLRGPLLAPVVSEQSSTTANLTVHGRSVFLLVSRVSSSSAALLPAVLWSSDDLGRVWTSAVTPCVWSGADGSALSAWSSSGLALACGSEPGAGNQAKSFYASLNGGRTWTARGHSGTFSGGYVGSLAALDVRTWVLSLARYPGLEITHDGGRTWSAPKSTWFSGEWWGPLSVFGNGEVIAAPGTLAGHELIRVGPGARRWRAVIVAY